MKLLVLLNFRKVFNVLTLLVQKNSDSINNVIFVSTRFCTEHAQPSDQMQKKNDKIHVICL